MATILDQGFTSDGYEATVRLVDGRQRRFHWLAKPADVQAAADIVETNLKCGEVEQYRRARYSEESGKWLR